MNRLHLIGIFYENKYCCIKKVGDFIMTRERRSFTLEFKLKLVFYRGVFLTVGEIFTDRYFIFGIKKAQISR